MSSPTSIEDLPAEMIFELFKQVFDLKKPKDLLACSMVNKRWHSIYATFKLDRLVAIKDSDNYPSKWIYSDRQIRDSEMCHPTVFRRLIDKPLLSNLKRLALCDCDYESEFYLNKLNRFRQLVHLEINIDDLDDEPEVNLSLPLLKTLAFHHSNRCCPLSIDCPQLSMLVYRGEPDDKRLLIVKHPETIRKLETDMAVPKWFARFKNVECLVTQEFEAIHRDIILSLPKLKELRYDTCIENTIRNEFGYKVGTADRIKRTLKEFMDEAKRLRGPDFKFRFAGFQLNRVKIDQIDPGVKIEQGYEGQIETVYNEYIYMRNYHLIEPDSILYFIPSMDYNLLSSNIPGEFPTCFFTKFPCIEWIKTEGGLVQNVTHFLQFLKSLKSLRRLSLYRQQLGQEFYDQLPAVAPLLLELSFREGAENELKMNIDFISKLSHLSFLVIDQDLPLKSLLWLVNWFGKLDKLAECYFYFGFKGKNASIQKRENSMIREVYGGGTILETESSDKIVSYFESI